MPVKNKILLNTLHIIVDGLFDCVPILLSFMIISFAAGEKEVGVIISLSNMVITIAGLSTIFFSQHFGLFRTISLILLLYGIGFFTNAFSQNVYLAGFCFIIGNAGFGLFHNVAFSYLTANSARRSLGKAMGDFAAIGDIGRMPLVSLAAFIAALSLFGVSGWRIVCLMYGLGALLFAGYIFLSTSPQKEAIKQATFTAAAVKKYLPAFSLLRNRQYALPMSASILDAFGSNQVFVFLPFLLFAKGIDPKIIASFALAFTFGCFLGKTALGRLVDTFGTRKVFVVSEVMMAILLGILLLGQQLFIVIGASFLLGIVTKGTVPVVQTIITEPVQKHEYDDIFAINGFSRGIANMVSPLLFGFIASSASINWSFGIMAIAAAGAVIPVLMMDKNIPHVKYT
ncbi:MAG: MFS transporter [Veillonellales bacterium]